MEYSKTIKVGNNLVIMDLECVKVFIGYSPSELGGSCNEVYRFSYKEVIGKSLLQLVEECWALYKEEKRREYEEEMEKLYGI